MSPIVSTPVAANERLSSLDIVRGFAVLGILMMNIQAFSMPSVAYADPSAYGDLTGLNYWVWVLSHVFFESKFITLFSLLFGAGLVLMAEGRVAKGLPAAPLHYRRMGWLLLIGLLHAFLFWYGDVLVTYALCGMVFFAAFRLSGRRLILLGLGIHAIVPIFGILAALLFQLIPPEVLTEIQNESNQTTDSMILEELAGYRGTWADAFAVRSFNTLVNLAIFPFISLASVGGLILIGMGLFKTGVFAEEQPVSPLIYLGLPIGLMLCIGSAWFTTQVQWDFTTLYFQGGFLLTYYGSLALALGYLGLLLWVYRAPWCGLARRLLASAGRMAFTNYLGQTLICTTLFYGYGFGLFGYVERWQQVLIVLAIWVFQLVFSHLWLSAFRFGPFEWAWRCLTYWRIQPIRKNGAT